MSEDDVRTRAAGGTEARFPASAIERTLRTPASHDPKNGAWMAAIVESAQDAIIGMDLEGTILSWNPAAEALYGYRAAEMIGRPTSALAEPGDGEPMRLALERLAEGERVEPFELVRVDRDGRRIAVSVALSPVRNSLGRPIGASSVEREAVVDATELAPVRRSRPA